MDTIERDETVIYRRRLLSGRSSLMRFKIIGLFLIGLLLSSAAMVAASAPRSAAQATPEIAPAAPTPTQLADSVYTQLDAMDQVVINLYQRISPSVVHVTTQSQSTDFFNNSSSQEGT